MLSWQRVRPVGLSVIFTDHSEYRFGFGVGGFGRCRHGGVEFTELFEETESALEGAFGRGSVAKEEVVFFDILGGPI